MNDVNDLSVVQRLIKKRLKNISSFQTYCFGAKIQKKSIPRTLLLLTFTGP